ncbi:MAG: ATP-binding protein, partial [Pseudomonadota bacterium]
AEREVVADGRSYLLRILPFTPMVDGPMEFVITVIDIEELKQANARASEMADFYGTVLSDIDEYILRWRADTGEITYCNDAYGDLLHMPADKVIGTNISDHFDREEDRQYRKELKALKPGELVTQRKRQTLEDGQEVYREGSIRAIGDNSGKVAELQSTSRNATNEIKYLEALEGLLETSQTPDNAHDEAISAFLAAGCKYFALEHGMLKRADGKRFMLEAYCGPAPDAFRTGRMTNAPDNLCAHVVKSKKPLFEHDLFNSKFSDHPAVTQQSCAAYIGAPIYKDGQVYGSVCFFQLEAPRLDAFSTPEVGFILLLSRWLGYKIERQDQLAALRRSETELQRIFNHVPARIWYKDDKNTILRLNETAAASMNVSVAEATGASTYDLFPEMARKYHDDDLNALESAEAKLGIVEQYTPASGEHGWVTTDKVPFEEADGTRNVLVISTDISDLKKQELELLQLNRDLEQANEGLRQFAYVASHDLQEPLRKIRQFSELLEETYTAQLDEDGRYFLDVVSSSAARMSSLIRDLLSFSKAAHQELETEDVDLSATLEDVKNQVQLLLSETGATLKIGKLPTISADPTMVEQLFTNLISNAMKYARAGQQPVIQIRSKTRAKAYDITIKDNGMGIEPEFLDKIFDPFTRLHSEHGLKGTGIGLAICKSVCERHGWGLTVDSEPNVGTTFLISISK